MWRSVGLSLIGGLLVGGLSPMAAQAEDSTAPTSEWTATGGFYGWFPWVEGGADVNGEDFGIYATPIDLIENFDAPPVMVNFEISRGKVSFWGDALYAKFAFGDDFASEAQPIPSLKVGASGKATTDYTLGVYQFGAFYQVADFVGEQGNTTVDLGAGARFIQQEIRIKARIDAAAQVRLGKLANTIERRIQKIENQEQRLQALAALNDLRRNDLDQKLIRAEDKGRERRVARLEKRLKRADDRGQALAALEAVEKFRLELLRAALRIDGKQFNNQFAFVGTDNLDWVDPTIALRLQHDFGNGHSVTATGDFGGYNVEEGLSSQIMLTYDIDGTLWGFDTTTSLGYKALWLSYEDETPRGDVGISAWLHGPVMEVALRW